MTGGGHRGGQGQDPSKSTAMNSSIGGFLNSNNMPFPLPSPDPGTPIYPAVIIGRLWLQYALSYAASLPLATNHDNDSESMALPRLHLPSAYLKH